MHKMSSLLMLVSLGILPGVFGVVPPYPVIVQEREEAAQADHSPLVINRYEVMNALVTVDSLTQNETAHALIKMDRQTGQTWMLRLNPMDKKHARWVEIDGVSNP